MTRLMRSPVLALGLSAVLALSASPAVLAQETHGATVDIHEWAVPYEESRPRDPYVAPDGTIWFVGQRSHYVATLDPETGEFTRTDLVDGAGPHTVIADEEGAWDAGNRVGHIGFVDPDTREIEIIEIPGDGPRDVHTMDFDSEGNLWFTLQGANQLGFMDRETREITLWDVERSGSRPYGIMVDDNDQPWAVLFGTNRLATVVDGELREIDLPRETTRPRRMALPGDGTVWYVDYADGYIGRYDMESEEITEWRTPSAENSRPYAMTSDDSGMLWFVETGPQPNVFVGFDPESETFTAPVDVPSGGGTVRHMVFDPETRFIWFGADTNTIGRAGVQDAP